MRTWAARQLAYRRMVPPPPHSLCCIAGTIVQRTVTESRGAQRRPAGGISDGAAGDRVGVLTMSTRRSEAAGPASNHGQRRLVMLPTTSWRWSGRVPWAGRPDRIQRTGRTPYTDCAMGLLIPVAHNRIIFIEIDFVSGRAPSNIRGRKTAPCGWIDRYLGRNL
jgi:hypothetical protein